MAWAALAAVTAAGCSAISETDSDRQIGIVELRGNFTVGASTWDPFTHTTISAPDTVQVNVPFTAVITTIGFSGCWREDGARVDRGARLATVTPYDFVVRDENGGPTFCTAVLVSLPRDVQITFSQAGTATLRVRGRVVTNGELSSDEETVVEKTILVQ
jgi:hypothetical protein